MRNTTFVSVICHSYIRRRKHIHWLSRNQKQYWPKKFCWPRHAFVGLFIFFSLSRVRMQTGSGNAANASVLGSLRQTLVKEGVRGLYRGVSAPLVASTPIYAISFWGYDIGQRFVRIFKKDNHVPLNLLEISIAGGLSALPTTMVMAPTERIKCLLQVQSHAVGQTKYTGMGDCAMQVYRSGGIQSLYKGTALTLMRDVPGSIAWWVWTGFFTFYIEWWLFLVFVRRSMR